MSQTRVAEGARGQGAAETQLGISSRDENVFSRNRWEFALVGATYVSRLPSYNTCRFPVTFRQLQTAVPRKDTPIFKFTGWYGFNLSYHWVEQWG
jgi:hypothetical protein